MPEKHTCEECGARMQSRRVEARDASHEEWYCPEFEKVKDELPKEDDKHPYTRAIYNLNKRKHPGRGHA